MQLDTRNKLSEILELDEEEFCDWYDIALSVEKEIIKI
jgi:hypothetical protein